MTNFTLDQLPPEHRAEALRQMQEDGQKRPSRGPGKRYVTAQEVDARREIRRQTAATEKDIQDAMVNLLRFGWLVLRINGGAMEVDGRYVRFAYWYDPNGERNDGIPDLLAFKGNRYLLIEVKRPDKRGNLSPGQVAFQQAAIEVNANHYVLCSVDELQEVINAPTDANQRTMP